MIKDIHQKLKSRFINTNHKVKLFPGQIPEIRVNLAHKARMIILEVHSQDFYCVVVEKKKGNSYKRLAHEFVSENELDPYIDQFSKLS